MATLFKTSHEIDQTRKQKATRFEIFVGSAFLALANFPEVFQDCILGLFDVPDEIDAIKYLDQSRVQILKWSLGKSKTTKELLRDHGSTAQQRAFEHLSNISPVDGLSQIRAVGECAVAELISDPELERQIREIIPQLNELACGQLERVHLVLRCGISGGFGSEGAISLCNFIVSVLLKETHLPIHVDLHLLGALTFQAKGFSRTKPNAGCSTVRWANEVTGRDRLTFTVFALELPPVSDNRKLRDRLLLNQQSAFRSETIVSSIRQDRSNLSGRAKLGNVFVPRTTFFRELDRAKVMSDIAMSYLPVVESTLETEAARWRILDVSFAEVDAPTLFDPETLLESLMRVESVDELEEALQSAFPGSVGEITIDLQNGISLPLSKLTESFSASVSTPDAAAERLGLLLAIAEILSDLISQRQQEKEEFKTAENRLRHKTVDAILRYQHGAFLRSEKHLERSAIASIADYGETCSALSDIESELEILLQAASISQSLVDTLIDRLAALRVALMGCIFHDDQQSAERIVEALPLGDVFSRLLQASEQDRAKHRFDELLVRCAGRVTLLGVSQMVGAESPTVESIASAIDHGHAATPSPYWGGQERKDPAVRYIVYPPMNSDHQRRLEIHHRERNAADHVCFAPLDVAPRHTSIVELRSCRGIDDFLTPFYFLAVQQAINRPDAPLYLDDHKRALNDIGIDIQAPSTTQTKEKRK